MICTSHALPGRRPSVWVYGAVFSNPDQSGIWRVFYEVMARTTHAVDYTLWTHAAPQRPLPQGVRVYNDRWADMTGRWALARRLYHKLVSTPPTPRPIFKADVLHASYFGTHLPEGLPCVVTVYDMIAEQHFGICGDWVHASLRAKKEAIRRADICICISQTTARDLARFYPESASKTRVVYLGAEHLLPSRPAPSGACAADEPYVLFVGHRHQYKNVRLVVEAMRLSTWPRHAVLHVVGPPFAEHERAWLRYLGVESRVRILGRLSDEQLRSEYQGAMAFVFPSLQEGFGLPVLEAQGNGCPVVLSDIPVFHEVSGNAAEFFDPHSPHSLNEALQRIEDPRIRETHVAAGFLNVRRFSWSDTAKATLEVYHELLSGTRPNAVDSGTVRT